MQQVSVTTQMRRFACRLVPVAFARFASTKKFTESHEWVEINADGTGAFGITDHAQGSLGKVVYIRLPEVGDVVKAGESCSEVESVKAAAQIYSPVDGVVKSVNDALSSNPGLINEAAEGAGWIANLSNVKETKPLMSQEAYNKFLEANQH